MEHGGEASVLDWVCRLTLFIAPALSIPGTYRAWRHGALGVGGRRPEPAVAALMCNLAWVMYGIQVAEQKLEPVSLNAWGGLLQLIYLITFLALCTPEERERVPKPMGYACLYLYFTFLIGNLHADAFKWFCTVAGWVSASAPLLSFAFLSDEWTLAVLPYWGISAFSVVHGAFWLIRGFAMENESNQTGPNYPMVTQNGLGAFCSLLLLLFALCWPYAHVQPTAQDARVRASITRTEIVDAARAAHNQGVTIAPQQTRHTRRRRTGQQPPAPAPQQQHAAPPQQPAGQHVPPPAVQQAPELQQHAGQHAPPPPQPAGQHVPPPAVQQAPERQQPAGQHAPPPPQPAGQHVPPPAVQQAPPLPQQAGQHAPPPPQPAGQHVPPPAVQQAPPLPQQAGQHAPPPPQPAGQHVPPPAVQQAPPLPQQAGQHAPPPRQPAGQQVQAQQQPAGQQGQEVRRSQRLQALVETSGGDQVPPATPSTSTINVSGSRRYRTRQYARATGQSVSIDIPEPIQRGPNHQGRF